MVAMNTPNASAAGGGTIPGNSAGNGGAMAERAGALAGQPPLAANASAATSPGSFLGGTNPVSPLNLNPQLLQNVRTVPAEAIKKLIESIKTMKENGASQQELEPRVKLLYALMQHQKMQASKEQPAQAVGAPIASISPQSGSVPATFSAANATTTPAASIEATEGAASEQQPASLQLQAKDSAVSASKDVNGSSAEPAPPTSSESEQPTLSINNPLTPEQAAILKKQIDAYRHVSRNIPIPAEKVQALLSTSLTAEEKKSVENTNARLNTVTGRAIEAVKAHMSGRSDAEQNSRGSMDSADVSAGTLISPAVAERLPGLIPLISPYSLLKGKLKDPAKASALHRYLVPSITPAGLDPYALARERERRRAARIRYRIQELESLPANLSNEQLDVNYPTENGAVWRPGLIRSPDASAKLKAIIELKALRLVDKQRRLREEMVCGMAKSTALATTVDRAAFRRMKKQLLRDVRRTEKRERQQRAEREKLEQKHHSEQLFAIVKHGVDLVAWHKAQQQRVSRLGKLVLQYHAHAEREEQKRLERISKERLNALRADDEEAYLKLIDQTKDTRIAHLLQQTNQYLENLMAAVRKQKESVTAPEQEGEKVERPSWAQHSEEATTSKEDYYTTSHQIQEKITEQPSILVGGRLKDYQLRGLEWMVSLYNNRLNGILADEMGLGKTIQTISLITYLIEKKKQNGPFLILVPLSTITNWSLEFEKWAPSVRTIIYKGKPPERRELHRHIRAGQFQVLLTTYDYVIRDRPVLSKVKWVHTIIDEGHRMKNAESKLTTTLTQYYSSRYRLILTGTPLQNNLPELWALLNFVLPKIFNSVKSFDEWFNAPFANTGGQDKIELNEEEQLLIIRRLHKVLRPFLLRRLKKDVEADLPDKVEHIILCKMSSLQQRLYTQMRKYGTLFNIASADGKGPGRSSISGLKNTIMQLRKICNHPFVYEEVESVINPTHTNNEMLFRVSGKFELLDRVLGKLFAAGHKVLIFFQMTNVMTIMEDFLTWRGWRCLRLDGQTPDEQRRQQMRIFNSPDSPYQVFLLSTRAGGQGLNLQTADTVIIFDSDWNPHQDLQAQDRAHRIGQKNEVRILRLITQKSIEVSILERAQYKLDIDGKVIQAGKFDNKSTAEEREAYLRSLLRADEEENEESIENQDEENSDEALNQLIARSEEELEMFKRLDKERVAREKELAKDHGGPGPTYERLITDAELPKEYLKEYDPEEARRQREEEELRTNKRRQTRVYYDDGLTEEQFLNAVENEEVDLDDYVRKVRERRERKLQKKLQKKMGSQDNVRSSPVGHNDSDADSSSDHNLSSSVMRTPRKRGRGGHRYADSQIDGSMADGVATPNSAVSSELSVGSRHTSKRARIGDTESILGAATVERKRGRKSMAANDHLQPEERVRLNRIFEMCYQSVANCVDPEYNRKRCELFLQLPKKRDYPDYYIFIKRPIAMRQIKTRIKNNQYYSLEQFYDDWKLMFDNARTYNQEGSFVYVDACVLQKTLEDELERLTNRSFATPPSSHHPPAGLDTIIAPLSTNGNTESLRQDISLSANDTSQTLREATASSQSASESVLTSTTLDANNNNDSDVDKPGNTEDGTPSKQVMEVDQSRPGAADGDHHHHVTTPSLHHSATLL